MRRRKREGRSAATPLELGLSFELPRVEAALQPWALGRNALGVEYPNGEGSTMGG